MATATPTQVPPTFTATRTFCNRGTDVYLQIPFLFLPNTGKEFVDYGYAKVCTLDDCGIESDDDGLTKNYKVELWISANNWSIYDQASSVERNSR